MQIRFLGAAREVTGSCFLVETGPVEQWEARTALLRRRVPPQLRAYALGSRTLRGAAG